MARARTVRTDFSTASGFLRFWEGWSLSMRFAAGSTALAACYLGLVIGSAAVPSASVSAGDIPSLSFAARDPIVTAYTGGSR